MASRQGIDSATITQLTADVSEPFLAVKAEFDTDEIRVWTGVDDITLNSETYTGAGSLLNVSRVDETNELNSEGVSIGLSYMDATVLDHALTENYQNRPVTIFMGFTTGGTNNIKGYLTVFKGRMVNMTIQDSPDGATIILSAENRLIDLQRPRGYRYTHQAQDHLFSGDLGLQYIQKIQDKEITWGEETESYSNSMGRELSRGSHR
jgi:hypothetical protein